MRTRRFDGDSRWRFDGAPEGESEESDTFSITCPYCGETVDIYLEADIRGTMIQDCEVCCRPWRVRVSGNGADRNVEVDRSDD
jgi:Cysteine-rich CPXCG